MVKWDYSISSHGMSLQLCHVVLHCSSSTVWSCCSLERLIQGQGFLSDLSLNFTCFTNSWSVVLCLHFRLPSMTSCLLLAAGCIPGAGGLHPQSQQSCAFLHLLYCAALASAPCWVCAQDQSCSWGRNWGGKGVGEVCGSPLPGLAGSMVCVLPALHWREESSAALSGLRLMDTSPFLPETWRGLGLLAQQAC